MINATCSALMTTSIEQKIWLIRSIVGEPIIPCDKCLVLHRRHTIIRRAFEILDYLREEWEFETNTAVHSLPCTLCILREAQEVAVWSEVRWRCLQLAGQDVGSQIFRAYLQIPGVTLGLETKIAPRIRTHGVLCTRLLFLLGIFTLLTFWTVFGRIPKESICRVLWPCSLIIGETYIVSNLTRTKSTDQRMTVWVAGKATGLVFRAAYDRLFGAD